MTVLAGDEPRVLRRPASEVATVPLPCGIRAERFVAARAVATSGAAPTGTTGVCVEHQWSFHDEARAARFAERAVSYAFVAPMGQETSGRRKALRFFSVSANLACYGPLVGSASFARASRCAFGKLSSTGSPRSRAPIAANATASAWSLLTIGACG